MSHRPSHPHDARDVFFYNSQDKEELGGLILTPGVTKRNFYFMIEIVLAFQGSNGVFFLQDNDDEIIPRNNDPLLPGDYWVTYSGTITVNDERFHPRTKSPQQTRSHPSRSQEFRDAVRNRDKGCVVTKTVNPSAEIGEWTGFEAAHIFPLAFQNLWIQGNYGSFITCLPSRGSTINSVQNGLLLQQTAHSLFDSYTFSINPDDNYKIVCFRKDFLNIAGRSLDNHLLQDPECPPRELFRWHFRQAVLCNMRGAGELTFEHDFPPGSDMLEEIRSNPIAAERMEFELFGRLFDYIDTKQEDDGDSDMD